MNNERFNLFSYRFLIYFAEVDAFEKKVLQQAEYAKHERETRSAVKAKFKYIVERYYKTLKGLSKSDKKLADGFSKDAYKKLKLEIETRINGAKKLPLDKAQAAFKRVVSFHEINSEKIINKVDKILKGKRSIEQALQNAKKAHETKVTALWEKLAKDPKIREKLATKAEVQNLMKAYFTRWMVNHRIILDTLDWRQILAYEKSLYVNNMEEHFLNPKSRAEKSLVKIRERIATVLGLWITGKDPRDIYYSKKWETQNLEKVGNKNIPRLPDWGKKGNNSEEKYVKATFGKEIPAKLRKKVEKIRELKEAPKLSSVEVRTIDGKISLLVKGENMPSKPLQIDTKKSWLALSSGLAAGSTKIALKANFGKIDDNIHALIKDSISLSLSTNLSAQVLKKIKNEQLKQIKQAIFEHPKVKPTIEVTGVASIDGSLAKNKILADNRAEAGIKAIKNKNPGIDKFYNFRKKSKVFLLGFGDIDTPDKLKLAENKLVDLWNGDVKPKTPLKSAKEIYAKLKHPKNNKEKEFVDRYLRNARGAAMQIFPPAKKPTAFAVRFEKPSTKVAKKAAPPRVASRTASKKSTKVTSVAGTWE